MSDDKPSSIPPACEDRRSSERLDVVWAVDCETPDTFLYASITNISEFGIFVLTIDPLPVGTKLLLKFAPPGYATFTLKGMVQWINPWRANHDNPNPGMGIRFTDLSQSDRESLVDVIKTIAYLRDECREGSN